MTGTLKSALIIFLLPLFLQANDKNTYLTVVSMGLQQEAYIPMIMKNYLMIEMHNNFNKPHEKLKKEIQYFGLLQERLSKLSLDRETKKVILKHRELWDKLKAVLGREVSKENFLDTRKYSYHLMESLKRLAERLKNKINNRDCNIIYYAGKLSAVSQRLASLYMIRSWGRDPLKLNGDMLIEKSIYLDTVTKLEKELSSDASPIDNENKKILRATCRFQKTAHNLS